MIRSTRSKTRSLVKLLACLCLATTARAGEPLEVVTADVTGPQGEPGLFRNWELGAQLAIPLPVADIASHEVGIRTGAILTGMLNPNLGVGVALVYHHWPTSDGFRASYNALLRHETSKPALLGTTTLSVDALQMAGHLKFVAPRGGRLKPWLQIGAGAYIVDPNTAFSDEDLISVITLDATLAQVVAGASGTVGVDLVNGGRMKFGLDVSFDHLWSKDALGSDLDAVAVGGHLSFGR